MEDMKQFLKNSLKKVESRSTCSVIPSSDPCSLIPDPSARCGSALLIVLGMLAFMVVSAVSFAMFMRQSRVPSSYLRRTASSRYLLKAALANAIARLDGQLATCRQIGNDNLGDSATSGYCEGVYDDPYPGVGPSKDYSTGNTVNQSGIERDGDYWEKRVFCPFGIIGPTEDQNGVPHYQTVATLTLEALAYLPPAIINEVRVYSRLTRTAMWRNLAFDAGRYAFCAVDVSDCFDLNRLSAGTRRSSAPGERVNLSSLFPDNGSSLDDILKKCSNYWTPGGGNIPFTSVADFNIVAGKDPFAPFCNRIGQKSDPFYTMGQAQSVSNALFITDTWFPPTNTVGSAANRIDLSKDDSENQPFPDYTVKNFMEIDHKGKLYQLLMRNIGGCGLACLYDYLDRDRIPISLALPTVEAAPMVCGLGLGFDGDMITKVESTDYKTIEFERTDKNGKHKRKRTITQCVFKGFSSGKISLSGVAAFPFKHVSSTGSRKGSFKVETLAAVFFADTGLKARVSGTTLHPEANDWKNNKTVRNGVIWLKGQSQLDETSSIEDNITTTDKALKRFVATFDLPGNLDWPVYYRIHEEEIPTKDENDNPVPAMPAIDLMTTDHTKSGGAPFTVLNAEGELPDAWKAWYETGYKADLLETPEQLVQGEQHKVEFGGSGTYRPYVAVWARVVDSTQSGKSGSAVVDLVPATCDDDETYLSGCTYPDKSEVYRMSGGGTPLLDFPGDHSFSFKAENFTLTEIAGNLGDGTAVKFSDWDTLYAPDPRFNFAPEDWFGQSSGGAGGDANPAQWKTLVEGTLGGDRDPDIFMFTSDQEHLQSIGELAFLPRVQLMTGNASFFEGDFMGAARYHGKNNFKSRTVGSYGEFANGDFMWQTYSQVRRNGSNEWDPIYSMTREGTAYEVVSGTGDFRVNPFSPDTRVLMAALKDTPADWFFASDDKTLNPTYEMTVANRASWAFCEESTIGAKIYDDELEDMAAALRDRFADWAQRTTPDRFDWARAFDDMRWYDDTDGNKVGDAQKRIFGNYIDEDFEQPLHGVDRKFLYSFWRECFQNRQQLFLVFLRAEPLTVGGMGEGSLASAQLGARGVALVWRDPQPPAKGNRQPRGNMTSPDRWKQLFDESGPHRTRVLFYHQFD